MSSSRIAYLIIPHLPVAVERRERLRLIGQAVVIANAPSDGRATQVLDCSGEALASGVRPGMPLGQAERLCPEATFLAPRLALYQAAADIMFEVLNRQMAAVEQAQPGAVYLALAGLEMQDRQALALCREQSDSLAQALRLASTAGVAANKFTAEAASLCIGLNRALVLADGTERGFLRDFPVTLLPVDDEIRRRLQLFGLRRLGQFARLPPAAVLAQFGWQGQHAHRLARGQDDRPVVPGQGERSESTMQEFDPPLDNLETLVAAAGHLAKELARRLVPLFLRASQLDVQVACVDSSILRARRLLAEPTADPGRLARLAEVLLRSLRYPDRAADLAIALSGLSAPSLHQLSLWQSPRQIDADNHLARLAARYGPDCIRHAVLVDPDHRLAQRRFGMQKAEG